MSNPEEMKFNYFSTTCTFQWGVLWSQFDRAGLSLAFLTIPKTPGGDGGDHINGYQCCLLTTFSASRCVEFHIAGGQCLHHFCLRWRALPQ